MALERGQSSETTSTRGPPKLGKIMNKINKGSPRNGLRDYLICRSSVPYTTSKLSCLARNHPPFLDRLNLMKKLPVHEGCVNTICWNSTGEFILSGSDDCYLCITKPAYMFDDSKDYTVLHKIPTHHFGNIFSAQFIPNSADMKTVSCSSEGPIIVHDINSTDPSEGLFRFNCHSSTIFEVATIPDDGNVFLSCGEDKTVRLFDLRCHKSCYRSATCPHIALIRNSHAITTLSLHPINSNLLLVGRADGAGLVYDRRKLPDVTKFSREKAHLNYLAGKPTSPKYMHPLDGVVAQFSVPDAKEKLRFTSLCFNSNGSEVLASYSGDYIYLFNHDKSSNFELIQTLPKNVDAGTDDNSDLDSNNKTNRQTNRRRIPRIRVRGDWSDTGINSVPPTDNAPNSSSQRASDILQRLAESALNSTIISNISYGSDSEMNTDELNNDDLPSETESQRTGSHDETVQRNREVSSNGLITKRCSLKSFNESDEDKLIGQNDQVRNKISQETRLKFKQATASLKSRFEDIPVFKPRVKYQGHRNSRTSIKEAIFWGDNYIMSGSDCGRIIVWEKESARIVTGIHADERVVNCLAPNPHYYALASSGIDYDIKLWSTQATLDSPLKVSQEEIDKIVKNNELMLKESRQTISVPPQLFFRVLVSLARNS